MAIPSGNGWKWGLELDDQDDKVVLKAEAPGFEAEDFDLQITGFGRMDTYHAPNEFAELSHMHDGFRILCHIVEKFG